MDVELPGRTARVTGEGPAPVPVARPMDRDAIHIDDPAGREATPATPSPEAMKRQGVATKSGAP